MPIPIPICGSAPAKFVSSPSGYGQPRGGTTTHIQRRTTYYFAALRAVRASVSSVATGTGSAVASIASETVFVCSNLFISLRAATKSWPMLTSCPLQPQLIERNR
jgi:hypothetical protein